MNASFFQFIGIAALSVTPFFFTFAAEPADAPAAESPEAPVVFDKPGRPLTEAQLKQAKLTAGVYPTLAEREKAVYEAATADPERIINEQRPMHYWIAQMYFRQGRKKEACDILRKTLNDMVETGKRRVERAKEIGSSYKQTEPGWNGFILWGLINVYLNWEKEMDPTLKDLYKYIFTENRAYKGTTSNLSMICTLNLYLAEHTWNPALFAKDARRGPSGAKAVNFLENRVERVAKYGSGEFASRPYMIYNIGTLLSLDNSFTEKALSNKAKMAYEMSIVHAAGTWLNGHWATPAGRSYPDQLNQQINGSGSILWFYFGGMTPRLDSNTAAVFAMAEKFRPSALIVNAATDRSKPYVHRSRFDGDQQYQTSFVNKTYALFSTAVAPGTGLWGQTYPYGVMFHQPDPAKSSLLWITVPCTDHKPVPMATHGINASAVQYLQNKGAWLLVAKDLNNPKFAPIDLFDPAGKPMIKAFKEDHIPVLSYIPGGALALINEAKESGRIFLNYGSVLIAITSSEKFDYDPKAGVYSGQRNPADSEFRIYGENASVALETALPEEYPGATPGQQLQAFRKDILAKTKINLTFKPNKTVDRPRNRTATTGNGLVIGSYTDRFGVTLEKTFDGDAKVNGKAINYDAWPLVENPWVRQERGGNLILTDGITERIYDVNKWTITEHKVTMKK